MLKELATGGLGISQLIINNQRTVKVKWVHFSCPLLCTVTSKTIHNLI